MQGSALRTHLRVSEIGQPLPLALHGISGGCEGLLQLCQLLFQRLALLHELSTPVCVQLALQSQQQVGRCADMPEQNPLSE